MLHIQLASDLASLNLVENIIEQIKTLHPLDEAVSSNLMMALHEALTNAIIHGNKLDPGKVVNLAASVKNGMLTVVVTDDGAGFNPDNLPDPLDESNLLKSGGRGVFLIRQFADQVIYNEKGNCITLVYALNSGEL